MDLFNVIILSTWLIVIVDVALQPFASVTITVLLPAANPFMSLLVEVKSFGPDH